MIALIPLWLPCFLKNFWKTFSKTLLRSLNELEPLRTLPMHPHPFPSKIFFQCNSECNLIKQRVFTSWGKENNVNAVRLLLRTSVVLNQLWTMKVGVYLYRMNRASVRATSPGKIRITWERNLHFYFLFICLTLTNNCNLLRTFIQ